ncbi:MAG: hypothetical protein KDB63_14245 [Nocardioidaceae bacterium]|nr:hypothetical protein [Nocardioidaceae bacterium]
MKTTTTTLALLTSAALLAAPAMASAQPAAARAKSTVTIKAEGVDLSGTLSSPRKSCVNGRKVIVIKQVGTRGGGNDKVIASDTASADGTWSTGNTGIEGRFYAKVKKTATCGGDTSKTIRAVR